MKKHIKNILIASCLLTISACPAKDIILESEILKIVDGVFLTADIIELIRKFQGNIINVMLGDKQLNGTRSGRYPYQGQTYGARELSKIERENTYANTSELQESLVLAVNDFLKTSEEFKSAARGSKKIMTTLIEESCTKRDRLNSLLLNWSKVREEDEEENFKSQVTSWTKMESFCLDLMNFLGDLIRSCPKAQAQFKLRLDKWKKVKEVLPLSLKQAGTGDSSISLLKFIKTKHLDALKLNDITAQRITQIIKEFNSK